MMLAVGGDLHIVADDHGYLELRGAERQVEILHILVPDWGTRAKYPGAIHLAGDADADADNGRPR